MVFNEYEVFTDARKQAIIHARLLEARQRVYERLTSDPNFVSALSENRINAPEDLTILLGLQDPLRYGDLDKFFSRVNEVANDFADLGGIILTEINPKPGQLSQGKSKSDFLI